MKQFKAHIQARRDYQTEVQFRRDVEAMGFELANWKLQDGLMGAKIHPLQWEGPSYFDWATPREWRRFLRHEIEEHLKIERSFGHDHSTH